MTIFKLPKWAEKIANKKWNHALVWCLRLALGAVFIFSGFTKAIDPWGGYYKIIEYCHAYGFQSLISVALALSFGLAAIEFMLGVFVLTGSFRRGATVLLLVMMAVMLPLTLDLAITDRVPHCGCFGDALVVSNWASFWKNVALTIALVYLTFFNRRVHGIYGPAVNWVVGVISFAFVATVAYNGYFKQPLIDFGAYPVGSTIGATADSTATDAATDMVFVYEKNGVKKSFALDSVPDEDEGWQFVERYYKTGKEPQANASAHAISILDEGVDVTTDVLPDTGRMVMFLFPDLKGVNISYSFNLNEIYAHATEQGYHVIALTSSADEHIKWWNDISMAAYRTYHIDDGELKSIARGNPAVVVVENGKLLWKQTLASLNDDKVRTPGYPVSRYNADYHPQEVLAKAVRYFLLALTVLLILNRSYLFYRLLRKKKAKRSAQAQAEQPNEQPEEQNPQAEAENSDKDS
ncbi:MAG: BT_3928 family protein [Sodaliphilus sp.]